MVLAPLGDDGRPTSGELHRVGGPVVDVDGDGVFEVFVATGSGVALRRRGTTLPGWPAGASAQYPVVADLEGDGRLEVLWISGVDNRIHCLRLKEDTYAWSRVMHPGVVGWNLGRFITWSWDPYEPNDPVGTPPAPNTLNASTAARAYRAFSLRGFYRRSTTGSGPMRELFGVLGHRGDRDYYVGIMDNWASVSLQLPDWVPDSLRYRLRVHIYNSATGAYAGTLESDPVQAGTARGVRCHSATSPCPHGSGRAIAIVEVAPEGSDDFGPWPYRLVVWGIR